MKRLIFVLSTVLLVFWYGCANDPNEVPVEQQNEISCRTSNTSIDLFSGSCRDDLLLIFKNKVLNPVDSAFNYCQNFIVKDNVDYSQKIILINDTDGFVSEKYDKFEKFCNYEMDETLKNKMLNVLTIYQKIIRKEFAEIVYLISLSDNHTKSNQRKIDSISNLIDEKLSAKNHCVNEIVLEYNLLHDKT
ncbi:MAG: hypothetical protein EOM05_07185 [Clostridia bacterium]|nr:hypothetical protein [Clostridia bacterium]